MGHLYTYSFFETKNNIPVLKHQSSLLFLALGSISCELSCFQEHDFVTKEELYSNLSKGWQTITWPG
jgi:hypothetical protein